MALKVKAVERLLKFDKNDPGSYRYVLKPELYTSLDQKKVRSRGGSARTGLHAIRTPFEVCREGGGREDRSDLQPSYHLHSIGRSEG